ncbi:MAG: hypothetical protein H0T73_06200 [Ardenticatenales bacterium]|nr:hypothetical protein [Ardenticatenales bacterium]
MATSEPKQPGTSAPPEPAEYEENVVGRPARMPDQATLDAGIELSDVDIRGIARAGVALLIFTVASVAVVTVLQWFLTGRLDDFAASESGVAPPPDSEVPYLIETRARTGVEYEQFRTEEDARLSSYGWVDEEAGIVHIPIEQAMDMMIDEGFPTRPEAEMEEWQDSGMEMPSDSSSGRMMERSREWLDAKSPK